MYTFDNLITENMANAQKHLIEEANRHLPEIDHVDPDDWKSTVPFRNLFLHPEYFGQWQGGKTGLDKSYSSIFTMTPLNYNVAISMDSHGFALCHIIERKNIPLKWDKRYLDEKLLGNNSLDGRTIYIADRMTKMTLSDINGSFQAMNNSKASFEGIFYMNHLSTKELPRGDMDLDKERLFYRQITYLGDALASALSELYIKNLEMLSEKLLMMKEHA